MFDPTESWPRRLFRYAIWCAIIIGGMLYFWTAYPGEFWKAVSFGLVFLAASWLVEEWIVNPITRRISSLEYDLRALRDINQNIDALHAKIDGLKDRLLMIELNIDTERRD
jgi:hypothetical protein